MFLSLHGEPSSTDGFLFYLAEKLHKSVADVRGWPALEIVQWRAYYSVQNQQTELANMVAGR